MKEEKLMNAIGQIDDKLIADAKPEVRVVREKVWYRRIAAIAACLVLALCAGIVTPVAIGNATAGTVTMEINPEVEYTVARNGNVKSVRFLNDDAKSVLGEVSLKGQSLEAAVTLTIAAYKTGGYMDRTDTVLVSFDKRLGGNEKLRRSVSERVSLVLEKTDTVHTLVYVSESGSADVAAVAEKYDVSQGRAELIDGAAKNSDLPIEDIVGLPLDELVALQRESDSRVLSSRFIGILRAKQIAVEDCGCTTRVEFTETLLVDGGIKTPYYRLTFNDKRTQWTYRIDATRGTILEKNEIELFITLEDARAIALKDAGLDDAALSEKIVFTREELSRNQGRPCWIIEFYTNKYVYNYKIDAKTGEIIYFEYYIDVRKAKEIALEDAGCADDERVTFTAEEYVGGGIKTPYFYFVFNNAAKQWTYRIDATLGIILYKNEIALSISLQRAKEIALADAAVGESETVVFTREELNRSPDKPCWVLEFYTEKYRYSYRIDAETGEIVFSTRYIATKRAKEIALADAGFDEAGRVVFTVEELVDGGIKTPYYRFVFNDGKTQWTYRIDATRGDVISREKESMIVSLERAKEIALASAGVDESETVVFTVEILSRNQGRPCWVLEFHTEKYCYAYKVDARTGEIIVGNRYLYAPVAKEIAIADAGVDGDGKVVFTVEELVDLGVRTPYYYFVFDDGKTQWTYCIGAIDGEILYKSDNPLPDGREQSAG